MEEASDGSEKVRKKKGSGYIPYFLRSADQGIADPIISDEDMFGIGHDPVETRRLATLNVKPPIATPEEIQAGEGKENCLMPVDPRNLMTDEEYEWFLRAEKRREDERRIASEKFFASTVVEKTARLSVLGEHNSQRKDKDEKVRTTQKPQAASSGTKKKVPLIHLLCKET